MDTSDLIATISAAIAALGLLLALIQFLDKRRTAVSEAERLAQQRERLRTAAAGAVSGAELADLIVQRAKEPDVTVPELQNVARALRQTLSLLAAQLNDEDRQVLSWRQHLLASRAASKEAAPG
jgi:hypothetical protein